MLKTMFIKLKGVGEMFEGEVHWFEVTQQSYYCLLNQLVNLSPYPLWSILFIFN